MVSENSNIFHLEAFKLIVVLLKDLRLVPTDVKVDGEPDPNIGPVQYSIAA